MVLKVNLLHTNCNAEKKVSSAIVASILAESGVNVAEKSGREDIISLVQAKTGVVLPGKSYIPYRARAQALAAAQEQDTFDEGFEYIEHLFEELLRLNPDSILTIEVDEAINLRVALGL